MNNSNVKILIVEDSLTQAVELKYILEKHNYNVQHAKNGLEAINMIKKDAPNVIISDVIMPEMDGYELCKQVKESEDFKHIPFILLTSLSDPEDVIKGLEAKADNFITKPYNEKFLISRIYQILINHELRSSGRFDMGIEVYFAGKKYYLTSERMQIIDLLLSTYENAVQQKIELEKSYEQLSIAHEKIKVLEANYRTLLERNVDAVLVISQEEIILYANPAAEKLFQRSIDKLEENNFEFTVKDGEIKEIEILQNNDQIIIAEMRVTAITWEEEKAFLATLRNVTENVLLREKLHNMSLTDELTGLYNRRGFLTFGKQRLSASIQRTENIILLYADLDNMKRINDALGHDEGDKALIAAANALKDTFRESDIIGRIGGDEFVVLILGSNGNYSDILRRLQQNTDKYNAHSNAQFDLSFSVGIARYDYSNPCTMEDLLIAADKEMYKEKTQKRSYLK